MSNHPNLNHFAERMGAAMRMLVKFGLDNLLDSSGSNHPSLYRTAKRKQLTADMAHARAHRRYYRNRLAKASRRANRGK